MRKTQRKGKYFIMLAVLSQYAWNVVWSWHSALASQVVASCVSMALFVRHSISEYIYSKLGLWDSALASPWPGREIDKETTLAQNTV